MAHPPALTYDDARLSAVGVRLLTPETTTLFEGTFSLMHCAVKDDTLYRGVFAVMMFPVSHPDQYISLRYTDAKDKEQEIGIIVDLKTFPDAARKLVQANLLKHYYEQVITRVYSVENRFGLLFFEVETQLGRREFIMPWRGDRAEDYGANGKALLDAFDNRYLIPDVTQLPPADRNAFTSFIYW
jgi:ATP-binding cassette, subfamily B, bacterial